MSRLAAAAAAAAFCASCAVAPPTPESSRTYADFLIGRVANQRDDYSVAADRYFAALARNPRDDALLRGALAASLAIGDAERARRAARMAPDEGGPALAHLIRSSDALRTGGFRNATRESGRAEGAASEELLARMLLLWARVGEGNVDDVLMQLDPLVSIRPYGGLFAYQQALALDYAGRTEAALAAYEAGAGGDMFLPEAVLRHADALARAGRRDDAIAAVRAENETHGNPVLTQALARLEAGQPAVDGPLTPAEGAAIGLHGLGAIFLQEYDPDAGLIALGLALMLDPDYGGARIAFAEAHSKADRPDLARQHLALVTADSPYYANARLLEAWIHVDAGEGEQALAIVRDLAAGGDPRARRTMANILGRLDRHAEAEAIYNDLIAADPGNWRLYYARAASRDRQGRWPEAETDLRHALELSPDEPEVLNFLGYVWVDRGERLEEAMRMIQRAVELRPNSGLIIDSLAWAYYRRGDYEQALLYMERAIELEPAHATLNDHLGDVYWRLGRRVEARFQWQRALTLEPDDPDAIRLKIENGLPPLPQTRSATR